MDEIPRLHIVTAERPGDPNIPSEDRIFTTPNACIVLDGATQRVPLERSGGWLADELGRWLQAGLLADPLVDLVELLDEAVANVIDTYNLVRGRSPSATVNIVRRTADHLDVLVLCDSPVVVLDGAGAIHQIRDDRISACVARLRPSDPISTEVEAQYLADIESLRNAPDGFWCISASKRSARQSVIWQAPIIQIDTVLAMTDGVSVGVDTYRRPATWRETVELAKRHPSLVLDAVHEAEVADIGQLQERRPKRHDDKALALITW